MIASVILCIVLSTSLRKNEWIRVLSSGNDLETQVVTVVTVGLGWVMNLLLLVKKQSPWHYAPVLWSTILSSGFSESLPTYSPRS